MCGIAGLVDTSASRAALEERLARMNRQVAHRGPDGAGVWIDEASGCALGHRRLAIIDLTAGGAQPMRSADGRYVITFNGEIYNYRELRDDLVARGVALHTSSDTEALIECWARFGAERALNMIEGMFAFAVWDIANRELTLVRDRVGVKPLLWSFHDGVFRFGSELNAVRSDLPGGEAPDRKALALYLRYGYVPAPYSIDSRARKLEPGHALTWRAGQAPKIASYWRIGDVARHAADNRTPLRGEALTDALDAHVSAAVAQHMVSDVPVGAFLSGGIDSSLVVAMMRKFGPVRSFTVGFDDPEVDESGHAEAIARALGTEHTTMRIGANDALALAEHVASIYDEPFADASQIPTALLCRAAREHVKVALSGDGGDEGFAGYSRYGWVMNLRRYRRVAPQAARGAVASALRATPAGLIDALVARLPGAPSVHPGHKFRRMSVIGAGADHRAAYAAFLQTSTEHSFLNQEAFAPALREQFWNEVSDPLDQMQLADARMYLPDDVLTKVDRASMNVGLEVRVPLLDHRVLSFGFSVPPSLRRDEKGGKAPLRALLARYLPQHLFERPKAGFAAPLASWLRGPLRSWADERLNAVAADGLDRAAIAKAWALHLGGAEDHAPALWAVIMFQEWSAAQRGAGA